MIDMKCIVYSFTQKTQAKANAYLIGFLFILSFPLSAYPQQSLLAESYMRSCYITRGFVGTKDPTIEGSLTYSLTPKYRINLWGLSSMINKYSEIDLTMECQYKNLTLSLIDYYNPSANTTFNYFDLVEYNSAHTLDLILFYRLNNSVPLGLKWSSYIYGLDHDPNTNDRLFSTYAEISYLLSKSRYSINPYVGFVPWKSWYANKFSFVNCGVKLESDLLCNKSACVPAALNMIFNPKMDQLNFSLIFGVQLRNKTI